MDIDFKGKRVLLTGAAMGIGRQMTRRFHALGAFVMATDVLDAELEAIRLELDSEGDRLQARHLDVSDTAMIEQVTTWMTREWGGVDIFVHVAGGTLGQVHQHAEEVRPDQWDAIFDVNLRGAFFVAQALIPGMKQQRSGRIILISSGAALGVSMTGIQAYASAKSAQLGLVRQLGYELGPHGITVNSVAPGFLLTNPDNLRQWAGYGAEEQEVILSRTPMRRLGEPDDIASATLFLASDFAGWITSQVLQVNGGYVRG